MPKTCPIEGCENRHSTTYLMCMQHWYKVPLQLRRDVWRTYQNDGVMSETYGKARDAAIASVS